MQISYQNENFLPQASFHLIANHWGQFFNNLNPKNYFRSWVYTNMEWHTRQQTIFEVPTFDGNKDIIWYDGTSKILCCLLRYPVLVWTQPHDEKINFNVPLFRIRTNINCFQFSQVYVLSYLSSILLWWRANTMFLT